MLYKVKEFFETECPLFCDTPLSVNFLGTPSGVPSGAESGTPSGVPIGAVAIFACDAPRVFARYADGGCVNRLCFEIVARVPFDEDDTARRALDAFFLSLSDWVQKADARALLPALEDGKTAVRLTCEKTYSVQKSGSTQAKYAAQFTLLYETEGV